MVNIKNTPKETIFVITGEHPDKCVGGAELQAYLIAKNMSCFFDKTYFCTVFSQNYSKVFEAKNLVHLSFKNEFLPVKIIHFIKAIKDYKPQLLYVRCLYSFWWIKIISIFFKIPSIFHVSHDNQTKYQKITFDTLPFVFKKNFYIWMSIKANIVVVQTKEQQNNYKKSFGRKTKLVYNAQLVSQTNVKKNREKIKVLWIGKQHKKPEKFVELFFLMNEYQNFEFIIIGRFREDQKKEFLDIQNNHRNFKFLGELSREQVFYQLQQGHSLINTSESEGFPNTFIEAWHRGVIVISDKINPDYVLTKNNIGFVCNSMEEVKQILINLFINDLEKAKRYSLASINYARENHNIEKTAAEIYKTIKVLIN